MIKGIKSEKNIEMISFYCLIPIVLFLFQSSEATVPCQSFEMTMNGPEIEGYS